MVIFKNLLEDSYDDFAYGIVLKDKRLFCLCGCNGTFEEDEYVIIKNDANPAKDTYLKVKSHKEKNDELLLKKLERFYLETACMREEALDYGYRNSSMSVIKRTTAKQLFDFGVTVYKLYSDDTEAQVEKAAEAAKAFYMESKAPLLVTVIKRGFWNLSVCIGKQKQWSRNAINTSFVWTRTMCVIRK